MALKIIGLGGIGSHLITPLFQYLNYNDNTLFNEIWLIDGDTYEPKNLARQVVVSLENKAIAQKKYCKEMYNKLNFSFVDKYVNADNISNIIFDDDIVLLCVDNNKTRKLFEDYSKELENITIISGGNELTDGNILILQKVDGKYTTPLFTDLHPELLNPTDKSPDELSCQELSESAPQISIVNATIADMMRRTLFAMTCRGIKYHEVFINCETGMDRFVRQDEIIKIKGAVKSREEYLGSDNVVMGTVRNFVVNTITDALIEIREDD